MTHEGQVLLPDAQATLDLGKRLGALLREGDVVALVGALGAGKTHLVRGVAQGMGLDPQQVSSPTFVLMQEYSPEDDAASGALTLVHIDAYRLSGADEFAAVLWGDDGDELRRQAVVVIEWADLIEAALDDDVLWIELDHHANGRLLRWTLRGAWRQRGDALMQCLEGFFKS